MKRLELMQRVAAMLPKDPPPRRKDPTLVLNTLKQALAVTPALRVGQLIENAKAMSSYRDRDLFYIEDHEFADMLTQYLTNLPG